MQKLGLTLTGGGARAAYQVGVLRGISEITRIKKVPFQIITGASAGAINGIWLASGFDEFETATNSMWDTWSNLRVNQVFRTDFSSIMGISSRWIKDLSFGEWLGTSKVTHLLETTPLYKLLSDKIDLSVIEKNILSKDLHGVAVSTTQYPSGASVTFFHGNSEIKPWTRGARVGIRRDVQINQIMASAAIPIFFPPVKLEDGFYGDGGVNMRAPLSPAIHLGADRIIAIGISNSNRDLTDNPRTVHSSISLGEISGALLNAMFLDCLDSDIERLERINRTLSILTPEQLKLDQNELRKIPILTIRPSKDLGTLASDEFAKFPRILRHMLKGLGASDERGWDLLSYLAFDGAYTRSLLELGHADALVQKEQILSFFNEDE